MEIAGPTAFVTGAAGGIGRCFVAALLQCGVPMSGPFAGFKTPPAEVFERARGRRCRRGRGLAARLFARDHQKAAQRIPL